MEKIVITVPRKGISTGAKKVTVDAQGFSGESCTVATKRYIEALGQPIEEQVKPEMHNPDIHVDGPEISH